MNATGKALNSSGWCMVTSGYLAWQQRSNREVFRLKSNRIGKNKQMNPENSEKKRILLLMSPATYRAGAFISAAKKLNLEVVVGIDLPKTLVEYWHVPLGVDFAAPAASVQTIVEYAKEHPIMAILSVDDAACELAALASAALGLAHNSPKAAEAARDKLLMRTLMSEGGAPCPVFHPFVLGDDP